MTAASVNLMMTLLVENRENHDDDEYNSSTDDYSGGDNRRVYRPIYLVYTGTTHVFIVHICVSFHL